MKPTSLAGFPERLSAIAYVNGEEVAWEQKDCADAIEWLRQNGFAVLGIELWRIGDGSIRTSIHTKSGSEIYVTSCDPVRGETWQDYVERSARDAAEKISAFHWPEDSIEQPSPVYFNLCWADREWFRTKSNHAAYFTDK
jgi:hypothetical protein